MGLFSKNTTKFSGKEPPYVETFAPNQRVRAHFHTNMGTMTAELFCQQAPRTVSNFIGLATGKIAWIDPKTGEPTNRPLYNGTIFHRVIPDFMIQGGDPLGNGRGGPGYRFGDEFCKELRHSGPGILSMANAGPDTNGSQFFITEVATPWLDDHHAVFGKIIEGLSIVSLIANVQTYPGDKPVNDVILERVEIERYEEGAN